MLVNSGKSSIPENPRHRTSPESGRRSQVIWAFGIVRALSAALLFCGSRTVGAVSYLLVAAWSTSQMLKDAQQIAEPS